MTKSFVHLHAHTEYSMLDGAAKIVDYLKKVKELNQPAAAITDHGNLYGAMEFVQKANDYGIKPIIGYEAYITPGARFDRPDRQNNKSNVQAQMTEWVMQDQPGFKKLADIILQMAIDCSLKQFNRNIKPQISDMWGMKDKSNDYT